MNARIAARLDGKSGGVAARPADAGGGSAANALQLLHASAKLAPWTHSDAHLGLPASLQHGPVLLLHDAIENADSPHIRYVDVRPVRHALEAMQHSNMKL